ncbi:hypothetical protein P171DRAFT_220049 [Karstenula rhodostoma CBS 690.94]|uniref:Uncharacterized protein n=1 Tax=Karstenula rhodostoma CBS 690.94 TaxID=1392251 RepID=A0A9P4PRB9_9PLEO|nr:hypothetical protein P171DRAFT_220049 [Karstenula rhodostoma CBS 690.94]
MCIGANEAFSLGDCLPMSAVCHEARSHASHFCRSQMQFIDVHFSNDDNPGEHRDVQNEADTLHLVNMQPTTVIMTKTTIYDEPYDQPTINLFQFASAAHLVDAVTELFGNGVERLILNVWAGSLDAIDTMYWPHIELPKAGKTLWRPHWNLTIIKDSNHDPSKVFLAPDRNFHAVRDMFREHDERLRVLTWHLLKYHEILVAAAEKLPRLGTIETQLHSRSWWKYYPTRVKATVKDGALWTDWNDVEIFNYHDWTHKDAEMVYSVEEDLEYLDYADSPYSAASSQYSDFGDPSYSPMSLQYPDKDNIPYTPQPQEHSLPTSSDSH